MPKPMKWRKEGEFYIAGKFKVGKVKGGWQVYRFEGLAFWPTFKHPLPTCTDAKLACETLY